jgi:hypothetical protein
MASALIALISLGALAFRGAIKWRERGLANLASCLLLVASFPTAVFLGHAIRNTIFSHELDRWNQAAVWVMTHNDPNGNTPIELPQRYADLAYAVHYEVNQSCGLVVDFFWGGGFPVKHTVRRYANNPSWTEIRECRVGWRGGRRLSGRWYEISD